MNKFKFLTIVFFFSFILQGCSSLHDASRKNNYNNKAVAPSVKFTHGSDNTTESTLSSNLKACLFQAETLMKLNDNYSSDVVALYSAVKDAKYYASIAPQITEGIKSTITPFYEYKVNDICNDISQLLMKELKSGLLSEEKKSSFLSDERSKLLSGKKMEFPSGEIGESNK